MLRQPRYKDEAQLRVGLSPVLYPSSPMTVLLQCVTSEDVLRQVANLLEIESVWASGEEKKEEAEYIVLGVYVDLAVLAVVVVEETNSKIA